MPKDLQAVVIADDLTGAADTGVLFTALATPVYLLPFENLSSVRPRLAVAAGLSVDTATRARSAAEAGTRVQSTAGSLPRPHPRWIYKKIDSCLRGNLGAEIDALLDTLGFAAALVAPALPVQGRTTVGGIHKVHGTPLAQTRFARDPITPVTGSRVAEILARQSRHRIGEIPLAAYGDPGRLQSTMQRECTRGRRLIVCDAVEPGHLDQVAALVMRSSEPLLPVGSAGLAASLVNRLTGGRRTEPAPTPGLERLLMVCGTGTPVTHAQISALLDRYPGIRHELAPEWLIRASAQDRRQRADRLCAAWSDGILALGIRPLPPASPAVNPKQAAIGLATLANLAVQILWISPVEGLFLSGGETAAAFQHASDGEAIHLERELLPGLVLGRWIGGLADGLPVITKAGAFGEEQTLIALYEHLSMKGSETDQSL